MPSISVIVPVYQAEKYLKKCVESGLEPEIPIELLASFYSGGCLSAATWWLINDMPCTSEEMVKYLDLLIRRVDKK